MTVLHHDQAAAITATRLCAVTALETALTQDIAGASEQHLHDRLQAEIAKNVAVTPHGWYTPPPAGLSVLAGAPPDYERSNFSSLREQAKWPRSDIYITPESLVFLYCSPVDRRTAMMGDFQMSLYGGDVAEVQDHVATVLDVTLDAVERAEVGMEYRELHDHALTKMRNLNVKNETHSSTDRSGDTNIGHTIPWFGEEPGDGVRTALSCSDYSALAAEMSTARVFLTGHQRVTIAPDSAFTVEPQITSQREILASFHFIVVFLDGVKHVLAGHSSLFTHFNMTRYLSSGATAAVTEYDRSVQARSSP